MADRYVQVRFKLTAQIGGVVYDDVVSMSATFGLNSIPTASLVVAVGKDHKRNKLATIHTHRAQMRPRDPVYVYLEMEAVAGDTSKTPDIAAFKIFEGYLSGIGYQRSNNNANYTINVIHWLDDLNNSAILNGNWFPGSAYDMAQAALYDEVSNGDTFQPIGSIDSNFDIVTVANAQKDLWNAVIKPIFTQIAGFEKGNKQSDAKGATTNHAAIGPTGVGPGALVRMPNGSPTYVPLRLNLSGLDGSYDVSNSIRLALLKNASESFAYTTFWNKLVGEYAPQFFFAISPGVEWATPIPFFAGLSTPWKTISADEYSYANFNANMSQLLECVNIFYPIQSDTGLSGLGPDAGTPGFMKPLGEFPDDVDQAKQGLKLYKEPPGWLTNVVGESVLGGPATGEKGPRPGDTCCPRTGNTTPPPGWLRPNEDIRKIKSSAVARRLAEHWYKTELLYQRHGELSGQLRFDIAPGSIIKIETPPKDLERYGGSDKHMFATVTQVSYVINAERAMAGTSFTLAHVRTEEENNDGKITSPIPPMWYSAWPGGPLSKSIV